MRPRLVKSGIVLAAIALSWLALALGPEETAATLDVGDVANQTYRATAPVEVEDEEATTAARQAAAEAVETVFRPLTGVEEGVVERITQLFATVRAGVAVETVPITTTTSSPEDLRPDPTTTVPPDDQETSTTVTTPVATVDVGGRVYLDLDEDGVFSAEAGDAGLRAVSVTVTGGDGQTIVVETQSDGTYQARGVAPGSLEVEVDLADPDFPANLDLEAGTSPYTTEAEPGAVVEVPGVGFRPLVLDPEAQAAALQDQYPFLQDFTRATLITLATEDVARKAAGQLAYLDAVEEKAIAVATGLLSEGIRTGELEGEKTKLFDRPPIVILGQSSDRDAAEAVADVVASYLEINEVPDIQQTEAARQAAADAVEPVMVSYQAGATIVAEGEEVRPVHLEALSKLGVLDPGTTQRLAELAVVAVLIGVLAFYLSRFRPRFWGHTKRVALLGVLLVLAAAAARGSVALAEATSPYIIPVTAFGFMAAILFDARIGVLMAVAAATMATIAFREPGVTVYALLAGLAPITFVSSISTRRDVRQAVAFTSVSVGFIAAAVAWLFPDAATRDAVAIYVRDAAVWAVVGSAVANLVALQAVSFFEALFDVTTAPRLLDVTDRNHPALQLLQEKAWGTFNHSLMVGTLADAASRAIGADNLLARAAAYYHDLGKTENPLYFIENQFGISNPHDDLPPEQSVEIIRKHVTDGMRLAARFSIPAEVAEGIVTHHGGSIMRYFYEKGKELYGAENVEADDYRHAGHKPRSKEMAILMMADAIEGACRAVFQTEDPTVDGIAKVVERVVGEKVDDGQLSASALTLGELSRVKKAFVDALVGHYHPRIPYPNFPGT